MPTGFVVAIALLADALLGEPRRRHPLVGFGHAAAALERAWNRPWRSDVAGHAAGGLAVLVLVVPVAFIAGGLAMLPYGWAMDAVILYVALGLRSLGDHAGTLRDTLHVGDLEAARSAVGMMVSRDTKQLDERGVSAAGIESVLENGSDAVFGTLFWFLAAGAPGVVVYRLVNTLDAMWGYRTERLAAFGWAAARLDDALNWIPARLTVLTYALISPAPLRALLCAWRQGGRTESPNAGRVMAAGAGALGVRLGGPGVYHGQLRRRPRFGAGAMPRAADIGRALWLVRYGAVLWIAVVFLVEWALA